METKSNHVKTLSLLILVLFSYTKLSSQDIKANAIGVVRFDSIENDTICLSLLFPTFWADSIPTKIINNPYILLDESTNRHFSLSKSITIADEETIMYEIEKANGFEIVFGCENDGGASIILHIKVKVPKKDYKGNLSYDELVERIIGFAIIDFEPSKLERAQYIEEFKPLKKVDFNKDGLIDAFIYGEPDEAMGGLCLSLGFGNKKGVNIDCCGP